MTTQINYDKKLTKFFSEVKDLKIFKDLDLSQYSFKLFIGGKGKGKSHFAFEELIRQINNKQLVGYLRNSEIEIKQIKRQIAQMIIEKTPYQNLTVNNENIIDKDSGRVLLVFLSTKNYNKISGNETPFGMIFYDEFNQDLKANSSNLLFDFFSILQTAFRGNKWNVWACGNTKTRNNIIYNMFKLDLLDIEHNLEILDIDKSILIVRYRDSLFKELNMNKQDLNLIKKYNPSMYDSMIRGISYEKEDELVLNNMDDILPNLIKTNVVVIYMNRVYELMEAKNKRYKFFIRNDELKGSIELINELTTQNKNVYELDLDYGNICANISPLQNSYISVELANKLKNQELFFNDYPLYLAFKEDKFLTMYQDFKPLTKN